MSGNLCLSVCYFGVKMSAIDLHLSDSDLQAALSALLLSVSFSSLLAQLSTLSKSSLSDICRTLSILCIGKKEFKLLRLVVCVEIECLSIKMLKRPEHKHTLWLPF